MRVRLPQFLLAVVLAALFFIPAPAGEAKQAQTERLAVTLNAAVDKALQEQLITGTVVMVSRRGEIIYERAAGFADREAGAPMRMDTIFRLSSLSKLFTGIAAAVQIQRGVISLDAPVTKWLPDFKPQLPDERAPVITIRHLLAHSAGLDYGFNEANDGPYLRAGVSDGFSVSGISLAENLRRLASVPLLFEPGTGWRYSLATDVLGAVVARAHGSSLQKAMLDLVTEPLGLRDAGFLASDTSRLSAVYYFTGKELERLRHDEFLSFGAGTLHISVDRARDQNAYPSGGAGMMATAPEVMALLECIRTGGKPLVGKDLMREFSANQIGGKRVSPGVGFGLGWAVLLDPAAAKSPQAAGTISGVGEYGHAWFVDHVQDLSVVIMTTTALETVDSDSLMHDVRDGIYTWLKERR